MNRPPTKKINIFLSLNKDILDGYFNPQDPSPLYKKQLSHEFEQYIMTTIKTAKRNTPFNFRISYKSDEEKQYAEPLVYAIRRHFTESKSIINASFVRFKRRSYLLLFMSISVVMVCQGLLPLVFAKQEHSFQSGLINSMDVLCWVILWKPIERLIFYWNPFLKEISVMDKLEKAEITITEIEN